MVSRRQKSNKYYIKTFGCYANEVDSDYIAGLLENLGFSELKKKGRNETEEIEHALKNADILVINSCSVRQKSEDKVYGIGKMIKNNPKPRAKVVLTGCMVGSVTGDRKRFSEKQLEFEEVFVGAPIALVWHHEIGFFQRSVGAERGRCRRRKFGVCQHAHGAERKLLDEPDLE